MTEQDRPGVAVVHRARLAAALGLVAAVVAIAWFSRALQAGSAWGFVFCALVAAVGIVQLLVVRDSRAPLMVADDQGVRVRRGQTWTGLRWSDIDHVEVEARRGLRDGRIVVHPVATEQAGPGSFDVPLAMTTSVRHDLLTGDLLSDLDALAGGHTPVLVLTRAEPEPRRPKVRAAAPVAAETDETEDAGTADTIDTEETTEVTRLVDEQPAPAVEADTEPEAVEEQEPEETFHPVAPSRETRPAARVEVVRETVRRLPDPPAIPAQRAGDGPIVVARIDDADQSEQGEHADHPEVVAAPVAVVRAPLTAPADAVIGPQIAAARARARLSVDELSERTRIRPHVLESIEVDDFEPCGGDFYARGHLRTLARVFGLDGDALVAAYDERYASAEIEARQVFEAELATGIGGGVRATSTGPRWTVLAAAVVALAVVWGAAQLFTDKPQELVSPAPNVVDSAGLAGSQPSDEPTMTLAPVAVTAVGADSQVVVRDRDGRILWAGRLAKGQRQQVIGLAPFDVTASNGGAVKISYLGKPKGTVGDGSAPGSRTVG
jgi:cytoskeleton protein RodZ